MADEARTVPPARIKASPTPAPSTAPATPKQAPQDTYQLLFPTLANLAHQDDFRQIIAIAEHGDLKGDNDRQLTRLLVTAPLTLAYLIFDELPPARYALTRLPDKLASHPLPQALFGLLAASWERQYEQVYYRAEKLFQYAQQPDFPDAELGEVVATLITAFVASFREKAVALLSRAFTSLPLPLAQMYLGLPADRLLNAAEKHGWGYDASKQVLSPVPLPLTTVTSLHTNGPSSLITLNLVADTTAKLEL